MKINILDFYIRSDNPARKLVLDEKVPFERFTCPICEDHRNTLKYSIVTGRQKDKYLEREMCAHCGHVFTSFGPSAQWHEDFYSRDWCQGKTHGQLNVLQYWTLFKRQVKSILSGVKEGPSDYDLNLILAQAYLRPGMRILEIGSGGGRSLMPFKKAGLQCFAVEPSVNSAQMCRQRGIKVFNMTMAEALNSGEIEAMDVMLSNHSLEHFVDPNVLIKSAARFVKDGGVFIVNVPNKEFVDIFPETLFVLHPQVFTEQSLALLLQKHGFRVVKKMIGENLLLVAVKDEKVSFELTPGASSLRSQLQDFYRDLWARRYSLEMNKGRKRVVSWDSSYLNQKGLQGVKDEKHFRKNGSRNFLIELEDVPTEYAVSFESRIDGGVAFGVIK